MFGNSAQSNAEMTYTDASHNNHGNGVKPTHQKVSEVRIVTVHQLIVEIVA